MRGRCEDGRAIPEGRRSVKDKVARNRPASPCHRSRRSMVGRGGRGAGFTPPPVAPLCEPSLDLGLVPPIGGLVVRPAFELRRQVVLVYEGVGGIVCVLGGGALAPGF